LVEGGGFGVVGGGEVVEGEVEVVVPVGGVLFEVGLGEADGLGEVNLPIARCRGESTFCKSSIGVESLIGVSAAIFQFLFTMVRTDLGS
jgi:hypothetical protein